MWTNTKLYLNILRLRLAGYVWSCPVPGHTHINADTFKVASFCFWFGLKATLSWCFSLSSWIESQSRQEQQSFLKTLIQYIASNLYWHVWIAATLKDQLCVIVHFVHQFRWSRKISGATDISYLKSNLQLDLLSQCSHPVLDNGRDVQICC